MNDELPISASTESLTSLEEELGARKSLNVVTRRVLEMFTFI